MAGNQNWFTRIQGTDVDLPLIRAWAIKNGSFFSPQDVAASAKVCVLGQTVNKMLFGEDADPTGQIIRIRNQPFRVVGLMGVKGTGMDGDMDDQILVPYTTVMKRLTGSRATPARRTNILNGIGGGSSDGMMIAMTPYFWMNALARLLRSTLKRFWRTASPPLRPIVNRTSDPTIEPAVAAPA